MGPRCVEAACPLGDRARVGGRAPCVCARVRSVVVLWEPGCGLVVEVGHACPHRVVCVSVVIVVCSAIGVRWCPFRPPCAVGRVLRGGLTRWSSCRRAVWCPAVVCGPRGAAQVRVTRTRCPAGGTRSGSGRRGHRRRWPRGNPCTTCTCGGLRSTRVQVGPLAWVPMRRPRGPRPWP